MLRRVIASVVFLLAGSEWCYAQQQVWRPSSPVVPGIVQSAALQTPSGLGVGGGLSAPASDGPAGPPAADGPWPPRRP